MFPAGVVTELRIVGYRRLARSSKDGLDEWAQFSALPASKNAWSHCLQALIPSENLTSHIMKDICRENLKKIVYGMLHMLHTHTDMCVCACAHGYLYAWKHASLKPKMLNTFYTYLEFKNWSIIGCLQAYENLSVLKINSLQSSS
jgi:hypothetical protein